MVLNITTNERTLNGMINLASEITTRGNSYLLFQSIRQFERVFKPPKMLVELLRGDWKRSRFEKIQIDQI